MIPPAITNLSEIAALLERQGAECEPLASWFRACLSQYMTGAQHGQTLEQAFGLALAPGEPPWWLLDARVRRDELILEAAARRRGSLRAIAAELLLDRPLMRRLEATGAPVSFGTIRAVLAKPKALPLGHAAPEDGHHG